MALAPSAALAVRLLSTISFVAVAASSADSRAPPRRLRTKLALTEISGANRVTKAGQAAAATSESKFLPSGWFGDFSQAESTYTTEGLDSSRKNPMWYSKYGEDPSLEPAYHNHEVLKADFFHESQSGGSKAAWQTSYPAVGTDVAGNRVPGNPWRNTPTGWHQDYQTMPEMETDRINTADWFDNSVHQIDGFGRKMQPSLAQGERYAHNFEGWEERSVNATIGCKTVGCTAKSSLSLLDTTKEESKLCSLSIHIHPTDYDDDYGKEFVEFWKVNGYMVSRDCNPKARGCNATAEKPLYRCLNGFNVDHLINSSTGTLVLEGKNSQLVDECPHDGNLLSGVAVATCMVRPKSNYTPPEKPKAIFSQRDLVGRSVLKCNKPGCKAHTVVLINPALALNGGKCLMNISVHQTDFDDKLGLPEQIDYIQIEGVNVSQKGPIQPGKNPCNADYKGASLLEADKIFSVVRDFDVTALMTTAKRLGELRVTGKISDQVDECGFEGNLLHGNVSVVCAAPTEFSAMPPAAQTAALHAPKRRIKTQDISSDEKGQFDAYDANLASASSSESDESVQQVTPQTLLQQGSRRKGHRA
jgi:hypothetical protein